MSADRDDAVRMNAFFAGINDFIPKPFRTRELVERLASLRRQAGVHTEDLAFNDGSDAQVVKDVTAVLPRVGVSILSDRLVVETVSGRNLSRFVIATQNCDFVRELQLQAHQVLEGLLGVVTAIDVVAHEDV